MRWLRFICLTGLYTLLVGAATVCMWLDMLLSRRDRMKQLQRSRDYGRP